VRENSGQVVRDVDRNLNTAINNWCDMEFYRCLIVDPKGTRKIIHDPYFECVGHSYQVAVSAVLWLLSNTTDPDLEALPDPRPWEDEELKLRESKIRGFYHGSSIVLPPVGAREIFEGQARFSQMQYLYFASGRSLSWKNFETAGMLEGVYLVAFELLLNFTGLEQPASVGMHRLGSFF
jgi:hypothetical protein